jgi:hypothetical protein
VFSVHYEGLLNKGDYIKAADYNSLRMGYWEEFIKEDYLSLSNEAIERINKIIYDIEIINHVPS